LRYSLKIWQFFSNRLVTLPILPSSTLLEKGVDDAMAIFMALEGHRRGDFQVLAFTLVAGNTKVENQPRNMLRILQLVPEIYGEVSNTDATPFQ
jgi:inosine-uridine nucleoside N-ribohydrolase